MEKKYELVDINHVHPNVRALRDFRDVKAGDLGGEVDDEDSLSQAGNCWVYPGGMVLEKSKVKDNAKVYGRVRHESKVEGNAVIRAGALVTDKAEVYDNAVISDGASVDKGAIVGGDAILVDGEWVTEHAYVMSGASYITAVGLGYTAYCGDSNGRGFYLADDRTGVYIPGGDDTPVSGEFWRVAQAFFDAKDEAERHWIKEQARTLHSKFQEDTVTGKLVMKPDAKPFDRSDYKQPDRAASLERIANLSEEKFVLLEEYLDQLEQYNSVL